MKNKTYFIQPVHNYIKYIEIRSESIKLFSEIVVYALENTLLMTKNLNFCVLISVRYLFFYLPKSTCFRTIK